MKFSEKLKIILNLITGKNVRAHNTLKRFMMVNEKDILKNISKKELNPINLNNKSKLLRQGLFKLRNLTWQKNNIYSASFGEKGKVIEDNKYNYKVICFSDGPLKNQNIEQIFPIFWNQNLKKLSLIHKYIAPLANGEGDYGKKFIWIDSRIELTENITNELFSLLDKHNLVLFSHYERSDLFSELKAIHKANRATIEEISRAEKFLKNENFKYDFLFETGVIAFNLNNEISDIFKEVYGFCENYISRDQIALPYILAKYNVKPYIYDDGNTNLREVNGIEVKSW
jgi:hypothetical protein